MRVGTLLKIAAVAAAVLVVALIAVVKSFDLNEYRGLIAQKAAETTGRELQIRGRIELALSLSPSLVVEDVAFANMAGGSREQMVTMKRLEAKVALLPLLTGELVVNRLVLVEPDILLEVGANGQANWFLRPPSKDAAGDAKGAPAAGGDAPPLEVNVQTVRVENGRFSYHDARSGNVTSVVFDLLDIDAPALGSPVGISGSGRINAQTFDIDGSVGALATLRAAEPVPVKLKLSSGGFLATADGTLSPDALDLKLTAEGTEAGELLRLAGVKAPDIGPFRFHGRLSGDENRLALGAIDAALGKADKGTVALTGDIGNLLKARGIKLVLRAESQKPAALNELLGANLPPMAPVILQASVSDSGGGLRLSRLTGTIGDSDIAGEATLTILEPRPRLVASLHSRQFDLADILGPEQAAAGTNEASAAAAEDDDRLIPGEPLPLDGLMALDAEVDWRIDRLLARGTEAEEVAGVLVLKNGRLSIAPKARIGGGSLEGELVIAAGKIPTAGLRLVTDDVKAGALLDALQVTDLMEGGAADLRVSLNGVGGSLRDILGSANGDVFLVMDEARIASDYADMLALDVMRQIAPWAPSEDVTNVNCMVARFEVVDGMATTRSFLFDTSQMTLGGEGTVDLGRESLDLTLVPRPKKASLVNLAMPMNIRGTFAKPSVLPNEQAAAAGIAGLAAGAALGPIGLLAPLVTTGGEENPCVEALERVARGEDVNQPRGSGSSVGDAVQGVGEGIGGMLEGIFGR